MEEFYIDIQLSQGLTRIQVDEVPSEQWAASNTPMFIIEYYNGSNFTTLTVQFKGGQWYDRNTLIPEEDYYLRYLELGSDAWNPDYQSPLNADKLQEIGVAISRHMIVYLTAYLGMLIPSFPNTSLN